MNTKNNKVTNILIVSLLVLIASVSIGFYFSRPQASVLASNVLVPQTVQGEPVEAVIQQNVNRVTFSKKQNDITVEITSTKIIATGIEIGICYTALDNGEWRPMPGHLFYGTYEIYPDEIEFMPDEKLANGKNTGTRCALIRYRVDDPGTLAVPVEFSILQFYAPGREMYSPCQELQQRLSTNPKANAYGLKAKCEETSDGNIAVTLVDNDKSVAKDKASKLLDEIAKGEIAGPWEFIITEIEK